jgi:primary-amine oxidase
MPPVRHPVSALSEGEIILCADLIRAGYSNTKELRFKGITAHEPSKDDVRKFEHWGIVPERRAFVNYYVKGTSLFFETIVNITQRRVESNVPVPYGFHGPTDDDEILEAERITLADPRVQEEISKLKLPEGATVVCDPWIW